ncbi:MAG: Rid family detoxifying hydrolase [Pseudomonadota bacterium]
MSISSQSTAKQRSAISTANAPQAIGTYSQAIRSGDLLFISGQIPLNPKTGVLIESTIEEEIDQVLENLKAVATAAETNLSRAVKITVFLTDLKDFAAVNKKMAACFSEPYPARAAVQVSALPKGARVEMDAIVAYGSE